jgi:hypothetical protein
METFRQWRRWTENRKTFTPRAAESSDGGGVEVDFKVDAPKSKVTLLKIQRVGRIRCRWSKT